MGYRGKLREREAARELRRRGWTMADIARELEVSKSSVSLWTRDVEFTPRPSRNRNFGSRRRQPNALQRRKHEEIERLDREGLARIGTLTEQAFLAAGTALYAGEGTKADGRVQFANMDPQIVRFFLDWLRRFFDIDETRLRVHLYLHEGLDLATAVAYWSEVTRIPTAQFGKPYRARPDATIRQTKHIHGCPRIAYSCSSTHRAIMGLVRALLDSGTIPG